MAGFTAETAVWQFMSEVLKGFLRLSDATNRLADGMWGGLRRPEPVKESKDIENKLSVGFGPWREEAGWHIRAAAVKAELVVYVIARPQDRSKDSNPTEPSPKQIEPVALPVNLLKRLITSRSGLPDHPIRPTLKTAEGNENLFALLARGLLVVCARDFDIWYRSERAKGKWASQRSKSEVRNGRPTKQTEGLRNAILALVRDLKWCGKDRHAPRLFDRRLGRANYE